MSTTTLATAAPLRLDGRAVFVTGAGNGLGGAIAHLLAAAGASVTCADLDGATAERTAADIDASDGTARGVALDVTDRAAVLASVDASVAAYGRLDVMCNVAGIPGDHARVVDLDEVSFGRIFAVHFKGVLFGCQAALAHMTPAGRGSIINMASGVIDLSVPGTASYGVAKACTTMLTKVLAAELGPHGIRANAVAPGFVPTTLSLEDHGADEATREAYVAGWAARAPMQTVGKADDIAHQVLYLASDASAFVTGQVLRANGGATMTW